ncbi:lysylphosphatidylglycerol synthase transmembrane domain-containing protein [Streptomyces glomeratus]|uniref:Lysylphosphatidylglycerol synthase domain-containing protein n=1 Tax=Streptomyces glomeratus TaxID=284452 RepID=A0ABP6LW62_9ACTN|nr:YbhN family protein [Streptomyces glomeratus]MCF1507639.1 YbhN family protein [Streptomyces glomeratus]
MTPPTATEEAPDVPVTAHARARVLPARAPWHAAVTLVVLVCTALLARRHWPVIEAGAARLAGAEPGWLLLGATAAVSTWVCSAVAQQGAVSETLPGGRLVATQVAASAANHLLPAGVGAGAVNLRFLTRCGLSVPRSATALAVKATAGAAARGLLIAVLAVAGPGLLRLPRVSAAFMAAALLAPAALPLLLLSGALRRALRAVSADVRAVHRLPGRAAALWGGSLAFASLHALVVIAVTRSLGLPLPPERVALAYLAASSAAVLLPTPGGIGSLDAALALALSLAGVPGSAAASVVLGYRLLTVWLPLVPGLVVLGVLVRRKAL